MGIETSRFANKPWWQLPMARAPRHVAEDGVRGKGDHGGTCQRIACENGNAYWFNETNGKYYCGECARTFNSVCRRNGQPPLCELRL
jgi:hypothetical protein